MKEREEWVQLFAVDEIQVDTTRAAGYSEPLTVEFLRENPYLELDTRFFDECFKTLVLAGCDDLDKFTDGLLISSENFQALNILQARYAGQVKYTYIDPPYNTGGGNFLYKDNYQHASWLSMMADRLVLARALMDAESLLFVSIDDVEAARLKLILATTFGENNFIEQVVWKNKYGSGALTRGFANIHEYILCYSKAPIDNIAAPLSEDAIADYKLRDSKYAARGGYVTQPLATTSKDPRPNLRFPISHNGVEIWPDKQWVWSRERVEAAYKNDELVISERNGKYSVRMKQYLRDEQGRIRNGKPISILLGPFNQEGTKEIAQLFGMEAFSFPKPSQLIRYLASFMVNDREDNSGLYLDFFAGSGTTGHAVINLNRDDGGNRKYILAEMGEYFDTVMKPRIQKAIYSKDWKDGKPVSREGSSHMFKYMTLESYEDALNNLEVRRPEIETVRGLFDNSRETHEDYMLRYMLDIETRGSASLLDLEMFEDPFNYQLRISEGGETHTTRVDLVETFNWLLGLRVQKMRAPDGYRTVEGLAPDGKRVLVIWRSLRDERHSNEALERFFAEQGYAKRAGDEAPDRIYVNGDCTLANLRQTSDRWDVLLTEEEFKRLMFAPTGEGVLS